MCLAFDCCPSDLDEIFWKRTFEDLKVKVRLHLGEAQAHSVQNYQSLLLTLEAAFGSKGKGGGPPKKSVEPKTKEEALALFRSIF